METNKITTKSNWFKKSKKELSEKNLKTKEVNLYNESCYDAQSGGIQETNHKVNKSTVI